MSSGRRLDEALRRLYLRSELRTALDMRVEAILRARVRRSGLIPEFW